MNFRKIIFPTDFSDANRPVLRMAASLARGSNAELLIAHVYEPPADTTTMSGAATAIVGPTFEEQQEQLLGVRPADSSIPVHHEIVSGTPSDGILKLAENENADLIVMGTHGRTMLSRLLMGSVAEEVVRHAPCPVMTLKLGEQPDLPEDMKRILVPTDLSDNSKQAVDFASLLARDLDAELHLLFVEMGTYGYGGAAMDYPVIEQNLEQAKGELERIAPPHDGVRCERHVETGDPASSIDQFAKEHEIDLIVMTTHGRTGLARVLMGSIAEAVVRRGACPVLTIRT